jgi:hypothetical protein
MDDSPKDPKIAGLPNPRFLYSDGGGVIVVGGPTAVRLFTERASKPVRSRARLWEAVVTITAFIIIAPSCTLLTGSSSSSSTSEYGRPLTAYEYQALYSDLGEPWVGYEVETLIAERGPPDSVLEAKPRWLPFKHGVHVLSYIYYNREAGAAPCIDAYVVVEDTGVIVKYYCR